MPDERRFPQAGVPLHPHHPGISRTHLVEGASDRLELSAPPDQLARRSRPLDRSHPQTLPGFCAASDPGGRSLELAALPAASWRSSPADAPQPAARQSLGRPPMRSCATRWDSVRAMIEKLTVEMAELRARPAMNSRNSSKPPSSDGYAKPAPESRRVRSGKKQGKHPGDPGRHLAQRSDPDATEVHRPDACQRCGNDLFEAPVTSVITRRVFDLPPMALSAPSTGRSASAAPAEPRPPGPSPVRRPPPPATGGPFGPMSVIW